MLGKLAKARKEVEDLTGSVERQDELKRDMETSLYGIIEQHKIRIKELEAGAEAKQRADNSDKQAVKETLSVGLTQALQEEVEAQKAKCLDREEEIGRLKERLSWAEKAQGEALIQADSATKSLEKTLKVAISDLQKQLEAKEAALNGLKASLESEHEDAELHKTLFQESQKEVRQWQERCKEAERTGKEAVAQGSALTERLEMLQKQQNGEIQAKDRAHAQVLAQLAATVQEKDALKVQITEQNQALATLQMASNAASKITDALSSLELSFSCLSCMELLRQPTALVPCGHMVCAQCVPEQCSECRQQVTSSVQLPALATALPKLGFVQQNVQFLEKVRK